MSPALAGAIGPPDLFKTAVGFENIRCDHGRMWNSGVVNGLSSRTSLKPLGWLLIGFALVGHLIFRPYENRNFGYGFFSPWDSPLSIHLDGALQFMTHVGLAMILIVLAAGFGNATSISPTWQRVIDGFIVVWVSVALMVLAVTIAASFGIYLDEVVETGRTRWRVIFSVAKPLAGARILWLAAPNRRQFGAGFAAIDRFLVVSLVAAIILSVATAWDEPFFFGRDLLIALAYSRTAILLAVLGVLVLLNTDGADQSPEVRSWAQWASLVLALAVAASLLVNQLLGFDLPPLGGIPALLLWPMNLYLAFVLWIGSSDTDSVEDVWSFEPSDVPLIT